MFQRILTALRTAKEAKKLKKKVQKALVTFQKYKASTLTKNIPLGKGCVDDFTHCNFVRYREEIERCLRDLEYYKGDILFVKDRNFHYVILTFLEHSIALVERLQDFNEAADFFTRRVLERFDETDWHARRTYQDTDTEIIWEVFENELAPTDYVEYERLRKEFAKLQHLLYSWWYKECPKAFKMIQDESRRQQNMLSKVEKWLIKVNLLAQFYRAGNFGWVVFKCVFLPGGIAWLIIEAVHKMLKHYLM